jgi:Zn-dependent M16 (insulinase) family peptidase
LNKTIQDLKMEIETIKKPQREATLEMENLGKRSGVSDASINNRIKERISGVEDTIEDVNAIVKENTKCKKRLIQNIQEIQNTIKRPNLRIIGIEKNEDCQFKRPENIFNKIIEENFPRVKKQMTINIQEAYRTPNRFEQEINSPCPIIIKTINTQNKERILKVVREKGQIT